MDDNTHSTGSAELPANAGSELPAQGTAFAGDSSPGWKTTEFWAHALVVAGLVLAAAAGALPAKWAAVCITASGVAYAISRGLSKQGNSN